jgi:hypothetical protein
MLLACGGAAVAILARDPRLRYGAGAVALVVSPALVAGNVWDTARFVELRRDPAELAALIAAVAVGIVAGAALFHRVPWGFPVTAFAVLPLRLPVQIGGQTSHLLVPLYLVIAAGFACFAYQALAPRQRGARSRPDGRSPSQGDRSALTWLERLLAATLVLYAIQTAYSADVSNAIENAAFFLVPFAVMFVLLTEVSWTPRLLGGVLIAVAAVGLVFAAVGFVEYGARDLLLSKGELLQSNQLHLYFRVNSLFYDPNIFGRYLALAIVALGAYMGWARGFGAPVLAGAVSGILLAALALTFSITSFVALVAGLLAVVALRWGLRWALGGGAAVLACGAVFLLVSGTGKADLGSAKNFDTTTSGRVDLVEGGIRLVGDRPVWGWGSGSFGAAFSRHIERAKTTVSHSEPITVGAEQGGIGLLLYVPLVVVSLIVVLRGAARSAEGAAIAACFVAMLVHSLGYAVWTTDPATWALLGVGAILAAPRAPPDEVPATHAAPDATPPRHPRPAAV